MKTYLTNTLLIIVVYFIIFTNGYKFNRISKNYIKLCDSNIEDKVVNQSVDVKIENEFQLPIVNNDRKVSWSGSHKSSVKAKEIKRTVEEYMALPASEYSVLSAEQIIRLNDHQFKCVIGNMNFFGNIICPVLYVDVNVYPELSKAEIVVVKAETTGSEIAEKINGSFNVSAINIVSAGIDDKGRKTLTSDASVHIDVLVPESKVPMRLIRSGGNFLIQSSLSVLVTAFVRILAADFKRWSAGDNSRNAVEGVKLG